MKSKNTTQTIAINNNLRLDVCPCCNSDSLFFIDNIKYGDDDNTNSYSGIKINLTELPELWECEQCNSWFTQNRVTEHDSIKLYSSGNSWYSKGFKKSKTKETVELVKSLIAPNSKVLDIGCSNGALLDFAKDRGALTYGLEYSEKDRLLLESKGHTAYGDWSEVKGCFDIIAGFDLVEHLYDLKLFLNYCYKHLSTDGVLIIMTGNISSSPAQKGRQLWWYLRYSEHILFPSIKYFSSISNFELVSIIKTYPYRLSVSTVIRSFIESLVKPRPNSFIPSPLIEPDHMLIVLKKQFIAN
jgi:2-polyprenyl-3-methyl-5-hydroxy-6-metoxy-1,4-benzoquinol methylase